MSSTQSGMSSDVGSAALAEAIVSGTKPATTTVTAASTTAAGRAANKPPVPTCSPLRSRIPDSSGGDASST
jgi:hypothetical protein